VIVVVLWACAGQAPCDSADCTGPEHWNGTARLDDFGWGCVLPAGWWFDVYTVGLTGSATVDIQEAAKAPLFESHPLDERASDPYGYWNEWHVELAIVPRSEPYAPGESSRFACADEPNLTFKVTVTGTDGLDLGCRAYGADPAAFEECAP
jgi:hypothetical protein